MTSTQQQPELFDLPRPWVVHCRRADYDIYVGRPSKWGNPFSDSWNTLAQFKVATRDDAIGAFEQWLFDHPELLHDAQSLRGKVLGCWCKPKRCHADVLARVANA